MPVPDRWNRWTGAGTGTGTTGTGTPVAISPRRSKRVRVLQCATQMCSCTHLHSLSRASAGRRGTARRSGAAAPTSCHDHREVGAAWWLPSLLRTFGVLCSWSFFSFGTLALLLGLWLLSACLAGGILLLLSLGCSSRVWHCRDIPDNMHRGHSSAPHVGVRGPTRRPAQPRPPTTECLPVSYGPGAGGAASPGPPLPMSAISRGVPWLALLVWRGTPMCSLCRRRRRHPHLTTPSSTRSHARVTLEDGLHAPRTHEC